LGKQVQYPSSPYEIQAGAIIPAALLTAVNSDLPGMVIAQVTENVPAFSHGIDLSLHGKVTFLVGENGSGKSTLLEAIAECCGFHPEGGNRDHQRAAFADRSPLAQALHLSWQPKITEGFFMRAESFYNFATYIEGVSTMAAYGGKSLHAQSHGESFIALFANRFEQGLYILDEPERRCHRTGSSRFSGSSTNSRHRGTRSSSSPRTLPSS
jgi:predicted ATPase